MSEVRRHTSNIGHPKNQKKKQGTSATQIVLKLKMKREVLVPIKTDSVLAQKITKTHTNKLNFEKNGFWCLMLHVLTVFDRIVRINHKTDWTIGWIHYILRA